MPLFYVISGYFFLRKEKDAVKFTFHKAKRLLIPYAFWGLFHLFYNIINTNNIEDFSRTIINVLIMRPSKGGWQGGAGIWFLITLFWANIIYFFWDTFFREKKWVLWSCSVVTSLCGMFLTTKGIFLPLGFDTAIVSMCFMAFGDFLRTYSYDKIVKRVLQIRWFVLLPLLVAWMALVFLNEEVNFRVGIYGNFLFTIINASLGTLIFWNFSGKLNREFLDSKDRWINKILSFVGENSIIYLCLNRRIIELFRPILSEIRLANSMCQFVTHLLVVIVTIFICSIVMCVILGSKNLRIIVGK